MKFQTKEIPTVYLKKIGDDFRDTEYKSRPTRKAGERIYKCNKKCIIIFEKEDFEYAEENFDTMTHGDGDTYFGVRDIIEYANEKISQKKFFYLPDWRSIYTGTFHLHGLEVYSTDYLEEVLSKTKADMKEIDKEADQKIFKTFFLPNVQAILEEFGLTIGHNSRMPVYFKDTKAFKTFIQNCIRDKVLAELEKLGIKIPLYNKWNRLCQYTTLFELENAEIDKSKLE